MRKLTTRFGTYRIGQYEKAYNKSVLDIIDIGNFEVNKIALMIKLGNSQIGMNDDDKAYEILDNYLNDEDNSILTAYIDILDEMNRDLKLFKGVDFEALKKSMFDKFNSLGNMLAATEAEEEDTGTGEPVENILRFPNPPTLFDQDL